MKPLSARQLQVLEEIRSFAVEQERMPSVRELAAALNLAASTVQQHIDALQKKGWLDKDGTAHGLRLLDEQPKSESRTVDVTVRGRIAAGAPIEAMELPEDPIPVPAALAPPGAYALEVIGDSMVDDHIVNGDLVIVRPQEDLENGTIAIALLPDGTATLKRIYSDRGRVRLQPSNPGMKPTWVDSVRIQGVVVGLLRKCS